VGEPKPQAIYLRGNANNEHKKGRRKFCGLGEAEGFSGPPHPQSIWVGKLIFRHKGLITFCILTRSVMLMTLMAASQT
jgi:hypothetical protein